MKNYIDPAGCEKFFAREDVLSALAKSSGDIRHGYRQNIALIGRGLIGKSSLLLNFLNSIKSDKSLLPVYINIKGVDFARFVSTYIGSVLYHSLKNDHELSAGADIVQLLELSRSVFPKTYDLAKRILSFTDEKEYDEAFPALWDINLSIASESGRCPVVVLDEFNLISSFPVKKPFLILGHKIMAQQRTLFILSSSATINARKILSERLSLLFGGFKVIDIGAFTEEEAGCFINRRLKGISISRDLKDFLFAFTGGHPFYLDSVFNKIDAIFQYGKSRINAADVGSIIGELVLSPGGAINQFFAKQMRSLSDEMPEGNITKILQAIVCSGRFSYIASKNDIPATELNLILSSLLEAGFLSKSGSVYAVTDAVLRLWLEYKARARDICFDFVPAETTADLAGFVEQKIADFKAQRRRPYDEKIIDLVTSFRNDQFFIEERLRVLPSLNFIEKHKIDEDISVLITGGARRWLFVIAKNDITEDAFYNILGIIKPLSCNDDKVTVISASRIDDQARLLAKQKKMWVWDRKCLSRLLEFYKGYNAAII